MIKKTAISSSALACTLLAFQPAALAADTLANWGQWRGPLGTGAAPQADPPSEWSETKNVKWKSKIPGSGISTPIVWGDKVFLLTAIEPEKKAEPAPTPSPASDTNAPGGRRRSAPGGPGGPGGEKPSEKLQFVLLCLDRKTGQTLWQKTATEEVPHEGHHPDGTFASASPVTDGEHVWAYFGSRGLHCYDLAGNKKWTKEFGHMITRNSFGEGASPALYGDVIIINWDDETENDFIIALDKKKTGKELWKKPRNESTGWSTPLVVDYQKKPQVVVNATSKVRSYDLLTGEEIWSCSGQTANAIPSPVADADTVYVMSGFRGSALQAVQLGKAGDLTGTEAIRWSYNKSTPYVPSPLLAGGSLYFFSVNKAELSCFDTKTGKPNFETERIEGMFNVYASPVAAKDRVYLLDREGKCAVIKQGPKLEILATNKLSDRTDASIAIAGKELFIRGRENLYCIAEK